MTTRVMPKLSDQMNRSKTRVFISYSRADEALVTPIVKLMRAIGNSVFQDVDSIQPGMKWRTVIEESIDNALIVLVFWCSHSKKSLEVRKEWERAIMMNKDIVPALLDDTPLEPALSEYQALDFRNVVFSHAKEHGKGKSLMPGDIELLRRRFLNTHQNNHLRSLDGRTLTDVVVQVLIFLTERAS